MESDEQLEFVLTGPGADVYLVQDGALRLVPDYITLQTLDARGFDAVTPCRDTERVRHLPHGRPLPPMRDGSLLIVDGSEEDVPIAYIADKTKLRAVPDEQTLSFLPRDRASLIHPEDLKLLDHAVGQPLSSVSEASQDVLAIETFVQSIGPLPAEPTSDTPQPAATRVSVIDGVPMEITEQRVRFAREVSDFVEISPIPDVTWAGAAVTGASVLPGALAPIALHRYPGWITITSDLAAAAQTTQSVRLETPSLGSYIDALSGLLHDLGPTDAPAAIRYRMEQVSTLEEAMVKAGINVKGSGWGVDARASLTTRLERSTTFGVFSQAYYQVAFTPDGSPPRFFADNVSLHDVELYAGPDNPPCYVSSLTYGRMLTFLVDSEASSAEVKAALKATYSAGLSAAGDLDAATKNVLQRSSVNAVVVGGSSAAAGEVITDPVNGLLPWIKSQIAITPERPASPSSTP